MTDPLKIMESYIRANEVESFVYGRDSAAGGFRLMVTPFTGINGYQGSQTYRGATLADALAEFLRIDSLGGPVEERWVKRIRERKGFTPNPNRVKNTKEFENYLRNLNLIGRK